MLSRTKAADDPKKRQELQDKQKKKLPELEDFIQKRDYSGAIALLEVELNLSQIYYEMIKIILIPKVSSKYGTTSSKHRVMDRLLRISHGRYTQSQTCKFKIMNNQF